MRCTHTKQCGKNHNFWLFLRDILNFLLLRMKLIFLWKESLDLCSVPANCGFGSYHHCLFLNGVIEYALFCV